MVHRKSDPRSPVQSQRSGSCLPFVLAALAALAFWGWRYGEPAIDWIEQQLADRTERPAPAPPPQPVPGETQIVELPIPAGQQPAPAARPARANLAPLFTSNDYPVAALRNNEQGSVRFRLTIDREGRVTRCDIVESSGSAALDNRTCQILTSRARFEPATDGAGTPIGDSYTGRIRWELPEF